MPMLLMAAILAATTPAAPAAQRGAIEVTIRGTAQPLEAELLLRNENEEWDEIAHRALPAATRRARFDGLAAGVYQILLQGPSPTERLAVKTVIGGGDTRTVAIEVEPFVLAGRVTLGGTELGHGAIQLRHREFRWRATIPLAADGSFRAPMWQRGAFSCSVAGPALPTPYLRQVEVDGKPLVIDLPDGRIRGIVRDARTGAPVENALVLLRTLTDEGENTTRLTTNGEGRFDFTGINYGRQTVRVLSPKHLEPAPVAFTIGDDVRLREVEVALEPGRSVAIVVIDRTGDPVGHAKIFAVTDGQICSRVTTDEDGMANVPVPAGRPATLFAIGEEGPFGMLRVGRQEERGRLQLHLPRTVSSLLIRAVTTDGRPMPPFSLLMRYNGELVPAEVAEELEATQGVRLVAAGGEVLLRNIPSGSYEFWPYRGEQEAEAIVAAGAVFPPIQVDVRSGENKIAVKFAAR